MRAECRLIINSLVNHILFGANYLRVLMLQMFHLKTNFSDRFEGTLRESCNPIALCVAQNVARLSERDEQRRDVLVIKLQLEDA